MNRQLIYTLFSLGLLLFLINSCEKDNNSKTIINIDLLTNDSSKIWSLLKIVNPDNLTIIPPSCFLDDERNFIINGTCLINDMGTIYQLDTSIFFDPVATYCKDTIPTTDTIYWTFNSKMDVLTISGLQHNILKLTNDSLVLRTEYFDSYIQTEYYIAKKE